MLHMEKELMSFTAALHLIKQGRRLAREGWVRPAEQVEGEFPHIWHPLYVTAYFPINQRNMRFPDTDHPILVQVMREDEVQIVHSVIFSDIAATDWYEVTE